MPPIICHNVAELHEVRNNLKGKVGFVPTMGALHQGHLSLIELAKQHADHVICSIYVNPKQFAPHEDFDSYPRTIEQDTQALSDIGTDIIYFPKTEELYPKDYDYQPNIGSLETLLEGTSRPHFFNGVAQVVNQLLEHTLPDTAIFGEKDYQQLLVIKKLFHQPPTRSIIGAPVMREANGLALSSRNQYLSDSQKEQACTLYQALCKVRDTVSMDQPYAPVIEQAKQWLLDQGFEKVDYLTPCDNQTLETKQNHSPGTRLLAAAYLNDVRLIDNIDLAI